MTPPRNIRRTVVSAILMSAVLGAAAPAHGLSALEGRVRQRARIVRTIREIRHDRWRTAAAMRRVVARSTRQLESVSGRGAVANPHRFRHVQRELRKQRWLAAKRLELLGPQVRRRARVLQGRVRSIDAWIHTWGVFRHCPIRGWQSVSDNFGITVRLPDVPVHRHTGNDIAAHPGTPIVAPFNGYASASSSVLGGLEVRVQGAGGYVYNAHLSSYGTLGQVRAGTVIGYVGATGDATGPHDHFEWHPGNGEAVDPYPYLSVSCDGS
jgi:murein DD-endopeptidase MepM/ murein hydrolase activator NlpD